MIKCCRAGWAYSRAFLSLIFFGPGITVRKMNRKFFIKLREIEIKRVLFEQLVQSMCLPRELPDVELLNFVVKMRFLNSHDAHF